MISVLNDSSALKEKLSLEMFYCKSPEASTSFLSSQKQPISANWHMSRGSGPVSNIQRDHIQDPILLSDAFRSRSSHLFTITRVSNKSQRNVTRQLKGHISFFYYCITSQLCSSTHTPISQYIRKHVFNPKTTRTSYCSVRPSPVILTHNPLHSRSLIRINESQSPMMAESGITALSRDGGWSCRVQ